MIEYREYDAENDYNDLEKLITVNEKQSIR